MVSTLLQITATMSCIVVAIQDSGGQMGENVESAETHGTQNRYYKKP